ncbi:MAG: lysophospholipid acyltransferase family protein [Clostridia bacterium]|nr:lysophospholipid acyltransferase family protein [Clostridia bacterium]
MENKKESFSKISKFWFVVGWIIMFIPMLVYNYKVLGERRLPNKKTIYTMNHLSSVDPIIVGFLFKPHIHFLAKSELAKSNFARWYLSKLGCIFINRGETDISAIRKGLEVLNAEEVLMLFPEGTRNKGDEDKISPFKTGVAFFALKSKAPLRAFYIKHKNRFVGRNYIICGEEYDLSDLYDKPINKEVLEIATQRIYDETLKVKQKLDTYLEDKKRK